MEEIFIPMRNRIYITVLVVLKSYYKATLIYLNLVVAQSFQYHLSWIMPININSTKGCFHSNGADSSANSMTGRKKRARYARFAVRRQLKDFLGIAYNQFTTLRIVYLVVVRLLINFQQHSVCRVIGYRLVVKIVLKAFLVPFVNSLVMIIHLREKI